MSGCSSPAKLDEGLERTRVLLLCSSAHAFGSGWTQFSYIDWPPDLAICEQLTAGQASETASCRAREHLL